jgi:hypothetical protein
LLATHPDITTLGEAQLLGHLAADAAARCGCGEPVAACPFWTKVRSHPDVQAMGADPFRESADAGRVVRPRWLRGVLTGRADATTVRMAKPYAAALDAIATLANDELGASFVVDASKDPYRLHLLRAGGIEPQVIVLTRDPRGFTSSMLAAGPPTLRRVARYAFRWLAQNLIFQRSARGAIVVRYEDLATRPSETLGGIGRRLGVDPAGFAVDRFRDTLNHALGGNPMRGRTEGIALDDRWRHDLSSRDLRLVWSIDGWWARRHGYPRRPS